MLLKTQINKVKRSQLAIKKSNICYENQVTKNVLQKRRISADCEYRWLVGILCLWRTIQTQVASAKEGSKNEKDSNVDKKYVEFNCLCF